MTFRSRCSQPEAALALFPAQIMKRLSLLEVLRTRVSEIKFNRMAERHNNIASYHRIHRRTYRTRDIFLKCRNCTRASIFTSCRRVLGHWLVDTHDDVIRSQLPVATIAQQITNHNKPVQNAEEKNLLNMLSVLTCGLHYVGTTSFRTISCFILNQLTQLTQNFIVTLGKSKVNALPWWTNAAQSSMLTLFFPHRHHKILKYYVIFNLFNIKQLSVLTLKWVSAAL